MTPEARKVAAIIASKHTSPTGLDVAGINAEAFEIIARLTAKVADLESENAVLRAFKRVGVSPGYLQLPPDDPQVRIDVKGGRFWPRRSQVEAFKRENGL